MTKRLMPQHGDIALLGAFCLFLSTIEYLIPKPLPFFRIGLANLPLLLAVDLFPFKSFLLLMLIKILGQALVSGTLFSYIFLFSLSGTLVSTLTMYGIRRMAGKRFLSFIGIGVAGATVSNIIQLVYAQLFLFGESARYIAPPFLGAGLITGFSLGAFCEYFSSLSKWYNSRLHGEIIPGKEQESSPLVPDSSRIHTFFSSRDLCIAGLLAMPALLFNPDTMSRIYQFFLFTIYALLLHKKINAVMTIIVMLTIILFNLFIPFGTILFSIGSFRLSSGALRTGIGRAVTLEGLIMLSKASIRSDLRLPGTMGALIGESFRLFALITERKGRIRAKTIVSDIDSLMIDLGSINPGKTLPTYKIRSTRTGTIILITAVLLAWLPVGVRIFSY
ncbi:membrane protein [Spirochaetia bacterium]|nr:membrane protein [Spirochaetia bacterium]